MTSHIRCLSLLILMACCAPTFFGISIDYIVNMRKHKQKSSTNRLILIIFVSEICLLLFIYLLMPNLFKIPVRITWWWIPISIGLAPINIMLEIAEGYIAQTAMGNVPSRLSFNSKATDGGILGIIAFAGIAITEEFIFRLTWIGILSHIFGLAVVLSVFISAVVYALNHIYYGINTVLQKLISGTVYSLLFVLSNGMLLAPVICHVTQNIIVVTMGEVHSGKLSKK